MFIPETIDLGQSEKYDLSIRIRPDGFMFAIADPENGKNYCLRETTFSEDSLFQNIQRIIFDLNFLTQQYRQTNVIFVSKEYDIVPLAYLVEKQKSLVYDFVHYHESSHILINRNEQQETGTLFNIDKELYEFLARSLYNPSFLHHTTPVISRFESKGKNVNLTSRMIVNFHDDMVDVLCFSTNRLLHCITYQGEKPANQLYYILKLWEKCEFDQKTDILYVLGHPDEQVMDGFKDYVLRIETSNFPTEAYLWNEDAEKAPLDLLLLAL